jgi:hypothetical protein
LSADTHSDLRSGFAAGMAMSAVISGLFVGSAVYGSSRNAECEAELDVRRAAQAEATARTERANEEAFAAAKAARDRKHHAIELAKQAADAARAGDCATVTTIDPQVCTLDADYRNSVFVRDVAVARCLGESPPPCPPKPSE